MYCSKCGTKNEEGRSFCKICGEMLENHEIENNEVESYEFENYENVNYGSMNEATAEISHGKTATDYYAQRRNETYQNATGKMQNNYGNSPKSNKNITVIALCALLSVLIISSMIFSIFFVRENKKYSANVEVISVKNSFDLGFKSIAGKQYGVTMTKMGNSAVSSMFAKEMKYTFDEYAPSYSLWLADGRYYVIIERYDTDVADIEFIIDVDEGNTDNNIVIDDQDPNNVVVDTYEDDDQGENEDDGGEEITEDISEPTTVPEDTKPATTKPTTTKSTTVKSTTTKPTTKKTDDETDPYAEIISQFREKWSNYDNMYYSEYTYHDIDEDGQDELIVHDGQSESTRSYYFYTIRNGKVVDLGRKDAWHSGLADGDKKLIAYCHTGYNDTYGYYVLTIEGNRINSDEGHSEYSPEGEPYFGNEIVFNMR